MLKQLAIILVLFSRHSKSIIQMSYCPTHTLNWVAYDCNVTDCILWTLYQGNRLQYPKSCNIGDARGSHSWRDAMRCDVIWEVLQPSQRELRQYLWTEEGSHMDRACPEQWGTKTTPCVDPIYLRGLHRTNISKTLHFTTFRAQLHVWQLCLRLMFRDRWTLWSGYRLPRGSRIDTPTHPSIGAVAIPLPSDF